ncbi:MULTISPECIES: hypothetical protein [unclassified Paracoccus (in: a-proteobacteria)]|uniref:hypothetical protein n=1 Tax=unclassified Paracoccus (in: a-proteobacteria) TaxID=2688777 RepID=UPI0012B1F4D2|nr:MULTISPECIES: hypothetical protein [unclassified Paracoccus (in: a-proteobacteria)]UXU76021.1 hypothetical protein GB879_005950 [Paracoccus sp. SMMA_5]UXU81931.1 hypothetical protein GB880_005935 [Paracoccus sp. SMMA_5_TC]
MSNPTTLTAYATAFLASISLFGLVDAGRLRQDAAVASAITQAYLLPVLWISAATFLALMIISLSRSYLTRPQRWNSEAAERRVLEIGLAVACYFGLLAMLSYLLALMAPGWISGAAPALARHAPWFLAAPCLVLGALAPRHKPAWLAAGAVFVTLGLVTG